MQTITTIGLDIAESVFQVHGVDAAGEVVIRRQLKRRSVLAFFQKLPAVSGRHAEAIWRSGHESQHAVCANKDARAAELPDASPHTSSLHPPADRGD